MKTMQHRLDRGRILDVSWPVWILRTSAHAQRNKKPKKDQTQTMDSLSYALGVLFATNLSNEGLKQVDGDALKTGFEAIGWRICDERRRSQRHRSIANGPNQGANGLGDQARRRGLSAENCKKDGIQTTESGLQYRHEVVARVPPPTPTTK